MMKLVLKVGVSDSKSKRDAMKVVSVLRGVVSLSISMEKKTMTVVGDLDPVEVVSKLRKLMAVEIESAGPNKEEEKKKDDKNTNKELEEMIKNSFSYYWGPNYSF